MADILVHRQTFSLHCPARRGIGSHAAAVAGEVGKSFQALRQHGRRPVQHRRRVGIDDRALVTDDPGPPLELPLKQGELTPHEVEPRLLHLPDCGRLVSSWHENGPEGGMEIAGKKGGPSRQIRGVLGRTGIQKVHCWVG